MWTKKRKKRESYNVGYANPRSKFRDDEIAAMRRMAARGAETREIANQFSADASYVNRIVKGRARTK